EAAERGDMPHLVDVDREHEEDGELPAEELPVDEDRGSHAEEGAQLGEAQEEELRLGEEEGEAGGERAAGAPEAAAGVGPGRVARLTRAGGGRGGGGGGGPVGQALGEGGDAAAELSCLLRLGRQQLDGAAPGGELLDAVAAPGGGLGVRRQPLQEV